jgi:hypothetical protein
MRLQYVWNAIPFILLFSVVLFILVSTHKIFSNNKTFNFTIASASARSLLEIGPSSGLVQE